MFSSVEGRPEKAGGDCDENYYRAIDTTLSRERGEGGGSIRANREASGRAPRARKVRTPNGRSLPVQRQLML